VEANGTNRLGIVVQGLGAATGFHRHRVLDWRWALLSSVPAAIGTALGVWLALRVGDRDFRRLLAVLMSLITLWTLLDTTRGGRGPIVTSRRRLVFFLGFLGAGVYGGFVQAGVGFLILVVTSLAGLDLVRGNAIKVVTVLFIALFSLAGFALQGKVRWDAGLALASGSLAGSFVGVRLAVVKGSGWIRGVVAVVVVLLAVRLWSP
jgi:hypothetical protein